MEYQIDMSDEAESELDAAYLYLSGRSLDSAYRWYNGAQEAIASLSILPRRCVLAHENSLYPNNEVRQLLYGTGKTIKLSTASCLRSLKKMGWFASCISATERGS